MTGPAMGLLGVLALLVLLLAGTPIGVALGLVGLAGLTFTLGLEPALIKSAVLMFETMTRYELGTLPLFLLMGAGLWVFYRMFPPGTPFIKNHPIFPTFIVAPLPPPPVHFVPQRVQPAPPRVVEDQPPARL